jgi:hypothetical protein
MAEINKLSVAKVLEKLRNNDAKDNRSKLDRLDDEIKAVDEEVQRLRDAAKPPQARPTSEYDRPRRRRVRRCARPIPTSAKFCQAAQAWRLLPPRPARP